MAQTTSQACAQSQAKQLQFLMGTADADKKAIKKEKEEPRDGEDAPRIPGYPKMCPVCPGVKLTTPLVQSAHESGQKHKDYLARHHGVAAPPKPAKGGGLSIAGFPKMCPVCDDVVLGSPHIEKVHIAGKRHSESLARMAGLRSVEREPGSKPDINRSTAEKQERLSKVLEQASGKYTCDVCKVTCNTQDVLNIHFTGKKHKAAVSGRPISGGRGGGRGASLAARGGSSQLSAGGRGARPRPHLNKSFVIPGRSGGRQNSFQAFQMHMMDMEKTVRSMASSSRRFNEEAPTAQIRDDAATALLTSFSSGIGEPGKVEPVVPEPKSEAPPPQPADAAMSLAAAIREGGKSRMSGQSRGGGRGGGGKGACFPGGQKRAFPFFSSSTEDAAFSAANFGITPRPTRAPPPMAMPEPDPLSFNDRARIEEKVSDMVETRMKAKMLDILLAEGTKKGMNSDDCFSQMMCLLQKQGGGTAAAPADGGGQSVAAAEPAAPEPDPVPVPPEHCSAAEMT